MAARASLRAGKGSAVRSKKPKHRPRQRPVRFAIPDVIPPIGVGDAGRVVEIAKSVTWGLSRPKTLALWRNIISRAPDQVAFARQYVFELMLTEGWDELDSFAAAARRYKSADLDLSYIDAALVRLQLDSARMLLDRYRRRYGTSIAVLLREYDLHSASGDFEAAAQVGRQLRDVDRSMAPISASMVKRARFYGTTKARWQRAKPRERDYDIFVVNLDSDAQRMRRMEQQLANVAFTRIPGVRGAYLPDYVLKAISQAQGHQQKGTMGCFMSHVVFWEKVAASGRHALVLEDDACVLAALPPRLPKLPEDYDICFVNERMLPPDFSDWGRFAVRATSDVAAQKPGDWSSAGTDGYLLSPKGAKLLLSLVETDGIAGDVDWRLVSYSLSAAERRALIKRGGFAAESLSFHERFRSPRKRLRSFVLAPSIVRQFAGGSVRLWDNELAHAHMAAITDVHEKRAKRPKPPRAR